MLRTLSHQNGSSRTDYAADLKGGRGRRSTPTPWALWGGDTSSFNGELELKAGHCGGCPKHVFCSVCDHINVLDINRVVRRDAECGLLLSAALAETMSSGFSDNKKPRGTMTTTFPGRNNNPARPPSKPHSPCQQANSQQYHSREARRTPQPRRTTSRRSPCRTSTRSSA